MPVKIDQTIDDCKIVITPAGIELSMFDDDGVIKTVFIRPNVIWVHADGKIHDFMDMLQHYVDNPPE